MFERFTEPAKKVLELALLQRIYEDGGAELDQAGVHSIDRKSGPSTTSEPDDPAHEPPQS